MTIALYTPVLRLFVLVSYIAFCRQVYMEFKYCPVKAGMQVNIAIHRELILMLRTDGV